MDRKELIRLAKMRPDERSRIVPLLKEGAGSATEAQAEFVLNGVAVISVITIPRKTFPWSRMAVGISDTVAVLKRRAEKLKAAIDGIGGVRFELEGDPLAKAAPNGFKLFFLLANRTPFTEAAADDISEAIKKAGFKLL